MQYSRNFYQIKDNEIIFEAIKEELTDVGYYDLPLQDTNLFKQYAKQVTQKDIAIIGIGGSTLGTIAIYNFLKNSKYL